MKTMTAAAALIGALLATGEAQAQWSIGAPGPRTAPAGANRYAYLVFANPIPGREAEFNDWYLNTHLGDLVQLPGWEGAQRFRIVTDLQPRPTANGYAQGYLVVWDLEGADATDLRTLVGEGLANGKVRRGAAFDYSATGASSATYAVLGPRRTRPDGKGPVMPPASDSRTPRPNRFMLVELSDVAPGAAEAALDAAIERRIATVLALPGWMAAQRFRLQPVGGARPNSPGFARYLTVWEIEAETAQAAQATLDEAAKEGRLSPLPSDPATARSTYWSPISPYVTKSDFTR